MATIPSEQEASSSSNSNQFGAHKPLTAAVLDAELLDDFFARILLQSFLSNRLLLIRDRSSSSPHSISHDASSSFWIQTLQSFGVPLIRLVTLLICRGQTPAAGLLKLERTTRRTENHTASTNNTPPTNVSNLRLGVYALMSILLPTAYQSWKQYWLKHRQKRLRRLIEAKALRDMNADREEDAKHDNNFAFDDDRSTTDTHNSQRQSVIPTAMQILAWERQESFGDSLTRVLDKLVPTFRLVALLSCWAGLSTTPSPAMILSGLVFRPAPAAITSATVTSSNKLSIDYAHRRWLYHEFLQTMRVLFLGLSMTDTWRPLLPQWQQVNATIQNLVSMMVSWQEASKSRLEEGLNQMCLLCQADPIIVPVEVNCCQSRYCYTCLYHQSLKGRQQQQQRRPPRQQPATVQCAHCGHQIRKARFCGVDE